MVAFAGSHCLFSSHVMEVVARHDIDPLAGIPAAFLVTECLSQRDQAVTTEIRKAFSQAFICGAETSS